MTIVLSKGIYAVGESMLLKPQKRSFSATDRLTIRAEFLPDDPGWTAAGMPTLLYVDVDGVDLVLRRGEVVGEANRLPYGLAAYAYTRSTKTAAAIGHAIESGMVSINHHGLAFPEVRFGGIKDSGYGSEGGADALEAYLNTKFISQLGM